MNREELISTLNKKAESLRHEIQKGKIFEDPENVKVYPTRLLPNLDLSESKTIFRIPKNKVIYIFALGLFSFSLIALAIYDKTKPNKLLFWSTITLVLSIAYFNMRYLLRDGPKMIFTNKGISIRNTDFSFEKIITSHILESFVSQSHANSITRYYIILGLNNSEINKIEITEFVDHRETSPNHITRISHALENHKLAFLMN